MNIVPALCVEIAGGHGAKVMNILRHEPGAVVATGKDGDELVSLASQGVYGLATRNEDGEYFVFEVPPQAGPEPKKAWRCCEVRGNNVVLRTAQDPRGLFERLRGRYNRPLATSMPAAAE